jgi:hypothetical protein
MSNSYVKTVAVRPKSINPQATVFAADASVEHFPAQRKTQNQRNPE